MHMHELLALRARLWGAKVNKHLFASSADYAAALEKECGPVDFDGQKHSVDHLLALVDKAIRVHGAPKAASKSTAKVEAKSTPTAAPKVK